MNNFGRLFRVEIFGESHGPAVGAIVDGYYGDNARTPDALARFVEERLKLGADGLRPLLSKHPERVRDLDAGAHFPAYLRAVEQLTNVVDEWTR